MFIITEDPVKKNGAKFTEELRIEVWRRVYWNYTGLLPSSILFRQTSRCCGKPQLHSQGEFTTPRCKNRKIRHEIEILKANEPAPYA
jgi:hypothetical protein